jgi:hypothetical protein
LASSIFPVFVGVVRLSQENRSPIKISSKYWSIGYELFRGDYINPVTGATDGASGGVYISPESMLFLAAGAAGNTTDKNLLIVGFEGTGGNGSIGVFEVTATSAIPEPSSYAALAAFGVLGLALSRRRRASR